LPFSIDFRLRNLGEGILKIVYSSEYLETCFAINADATGEETA